MVGKRVETENHKSKLKNYFYLLCLLLGLHQVASASVITFENVPNGPLSTYAESAFIVSPISGAWNATNVYGNPSPYIEFSYQAGESAKTSTIEITHQHLPFTFSSVDLYASVTEIPYAITGFLNSVPQFLLQGTIPMTFGGFETLFNPTANYVIDSLSISLTSVEIFCCSNSMGLDNIAVTAVSIVEPHTISLFMSALFIGLFPSALRKPFYFKHKYIK